MLKLEKTAQLEELINKFKENISEYKSQKYNEIQVKNDFIDKLFCIFEWDIKNEKKHPSSEREAVRDDSFYTKGSINAPDYAFNAGRGRKFFAEAKKPMIFLKEDISAAFYLRSYAYSANVPLSILTDFEEFSVYDTRIAPNISDKADNSRIFYFNYEEYPKNFELIYNLFSRTAVMQGSLDKFASDNTLKTETTTIDKTLMKLISTWKTDLENNIVLKNKNIRKENAKTAAFKIIGCIIFLRILEDKGIEPERKLMEVSGQNNIYKNLVVLFAEAGRKYPDGLFNCADDMNALLIDDRALCNIIASIYYPKCPFHFSAVPVDLLSSVFERVICDYALLQVPDEIMHNIILETAGKKTENAPDIKMLKKIRIINPASRSGALLVRAYSFMHDLYLKHYLKDIPKGLKDQRICLDANNDY